MNTDNLVFCRKYGSKMPGLTKAPLKGPIGEIILHNVSADAWQTWVEAQIKIINEERLDLSDINAQKRLFSRMVEYLGLGELVDANA